MIQSIETTGKTTEDALKAALAELGLTRDEVSVEIVTMPKSGFFGIGAVPAKLRVSFDDGRPEPQAAPEREKKPAAEKKPAPARNPGSEKKPAAAKAPKAKAPASAPAHAPESAARPAGSREEEAETFLRGLLERMGVECTIAIAPREGGGMDITLDGENMGAVIGRKGETLDAIQHLVNYTVNRGSTIVFPAYMTITTEDSRLSIADGHTVSLLQDIHIGYGSSTALEFTLTHIDTEGFVKPGTGKLSISGTVGVKGSVTISGADFGKLPASFGMYAKVSATGMDVKELVGRFNVSASTNNVTYTLEGVAESLRNNKIILSDPGMSVTIFNGSPFRLTVNSSITADIDGAESYMMDITDFVLEPEKSNVFSLPKEDARYLTQRIPMRFVMGGTTAVSDSSIPVRVTAGESYTYSVDYAFDAPLAFDSGTDITYTTVLEDVKIDLGTNFRNSDASLDFDIINTLPFDIEIDACVLDGEGNPVTDITVGSPVAIKAGSTASPSTTAANIDMHFSANFNGRIPNIQLTIHGTVPEGFSGTVWNKDQYIKIENAAVHTGPVSIE